MTVVQCTECGSVMPLDDVQTDLDATGLEIRVCPDCGSEQSFYQMPVTTCRDCIRLGECYGLDWRDEQDRIPEDCERFNPAFDPHRECTNCRLYPACKRTAPDYMDASTCREYYPKEGTA